MAITAPPDITPYPEAPQRGQPESVFIPLANNFVASLEPRRVEMQALADWMEAAGEYVDTKITDNKTAIDTVHANITDVNTVADDIANVNTAAGSIANVNTTAANIANVNKVAAIDDDVSTVAASDLAVNTVATDIANVNTTAGSIANVNAVATDIANVNTTATNIADVNAVAADILAVQAAAALSKRQSLYARSLALNPPMANETLRLDYANRAYGIGDKTTGLIDDIQPFGGAHTFTRATPKWAFDAIGTLVEVPANEPAYQYDPVTGEPLGLLIEESRTNLLLWSEDFTKGAWSLAADITPNATRAPDGVMSAAKLTGTGVAGGDTLSQVLSVPTERRRYTASVYVKSSGDEGSYVLTLQGSNTANRVQCGFIISAGYITAGTPITSGTGFSNPEARVSLVGGGWYRVSVTGLSDESGYIGMRSFTSPSSLSYYLWGAQLEERSTPSSYIPTEGAQVTRAADTPSRGLGGEYNPSSGTFFVEFTMPSEGDFSANQTTGVIFGAYGGLTERIFIEAMPVGGVRLRLTNSVSGPQDMSHPTIQITPGTLVRAAGSWSSDEILRFAANGVYSENTTLVNGAPNVTSFRLGYRDGNYDRVNVKVKSCLYIPRALSESELIALTTQEV